MDKRWKERKENEDGNGRHDFFDEFFYDFDEEFRRLNERFNRTFENMFSEVGEISKENIEFLGKPHVYGFTMRIGRDGKPHIEEFGDIPPKRISSEEEIIEGFREPLTDVIEDEKKVSVTVELPGVSKEDIYVDIGTNSLTIKADIEERKYYKEIKLPCKVKSEAIKATYNNGVLDIVMDKKSLEDKKRIKID